MECILGVTMGTNVNIVKMVRHGGTPPPKIYCPCVVKLLKPPYLFINPMSGINRVECLVEKLPIRFHNHALMTYLPSYDRGTPGLS